MIIHRSTSLMSSSQHHQQSPACLVRLTVIIFVMGGRWSCSCCFLGCCFQDLFNTVRSIIAAKVFFPIRLDSVQVVHPYSSIDTTSAWKKLRFLLLVRSDFHKTDSLSIAAHDFASRSLRFFSVDETLRQR